MKRATDLPDARSQAILYRLGRVSAEMAKREIGAVILMDTGFQSVSPRTRI